MGLSEVRADCKISEGDDGKMSIKYLNSKEIKKIFKEVYKEEWNHDFRTMDDEKFIRIPCLQNWFDFEIIDKKSEYGVFKQVRFLRNNPIIHVTVEFVNMNTYLRVEYVDVNKCVLVSENFDISNHGVSEKIEKGYALAGKCAIRITNLYDEKESFYAE